MKSDKRRQTAVPCYICLETVKEYDDVVYCSVCGEQYHKKCWQKNNGKCKVYKCSGETYKLWQKVEPVILGFLGIRNSKLIRECPNCQGSLSPLDRYCLSCGSDVNRPEKQSTFNFYSFSLFIRKTRKIVYILALALALVLIFVVKVSLVNTTGAARNYISEYATQNAPTATLTHRPYTVTPTFFTLTPRPTFTYTLRPPDTNTPRPTFTYTPKPTFTPKSTSAIPCNKVSVGDSYIDSKGVFIHISFCGSNSYDVGPFPLGVYKLSSSQKFFVYVAADYDGSVYISKIGDAYIERLGRLRQDHNFSAFFKSEDPAYRLTLSDDWLIIYEEKFGDSASYAIPSKYTR